MALLPRGTLLDGHYSIAQRIAENEYSVVYKAFDVSADGRPVAIKVVRVVSDDGVSLELYRRELDSLSRLRHPHIVRLLGAHDDPQFGPWMALEWMDGGSLGTPATRVKFATFDAQLRTLRALLEGLSFAHLNHVLHRDIKPANILYTADGTAKLADFNVSKILRRATAIRTVKHIFTAEYAAPEQRASRIATERSDIYSLGKVLSELVTGATAGEDDEALMRGLEATPMRGSLRRLLRRMIASEPTERPTAIEALREVEALLLALQPMPCMAIKVTDAVLLSVGALSKKALSSNEQRVAIEADLAGPLLVKLKTQPSPKGGTTYTLLGRRYSFLAVAAQNDFGDLSSMLLTSAAERDPSWEARERRVAIELPMTCRVASKDGFGEFAADAAAFVEMHRQLAQVEGTVAADGQRRRWQVKAWRDYIGVVQELRQREGAIGVVQHCREREDEQLVEIRVARTGGGDENLEEARIAYQSPNTGAPIPLGIVLEASASTLVVRLHDDFRSELPLPPGSRILLDGQQEASALRRQIAALNTLEDRADTKGDLIDLIVFPERAADTIPVHITPRTSGLDPRNRAVVEAALGTERLFLVQGPPGTGKTTVITELVAQILERERDSRILLVSQANVAVDNVLERLPLLVGDVPAVRLGRTEKVAPAVRHMLLETRLREEARAVRARATEATDLLDTLPHNAGNLSALSELWTVAKERTGDRQEVRRLAEDVLGHAAVGNDVDLDERIQAARYIAAKPEEWHRARRTLQQKWIERLNGSGELESILFANMRIVAGTCVGVIATRVVAEQKFDWVIVDEAGRASAPELLVPLIRGNRIVLVGDHRQLPPILDRAALDETFERGEVARAEFERSLFEMLFNGVNDGARTALTRQYRMHPRIAGLIEECFYSGGLSNGVTAEQRQLAQQLWGTPLRWFDTSEIQAEEREAGTSFTNPEEVRLIARDIAKTFTDAAQAGAPPMSVGVLSGYARQVEALEDELSRQTLPRDGDRIQTLSVDASQGKEFDIVYYSAVRSNRLGRIGFLQDERRLNVALSRAKHGLTIVGNLRGLMEADTRYGPNPFLSISRYFRELKDERAIIRIGRHAS